MRVIVLMRTDDAGWRAGRKKKEEEEERGSLLVMRLPFRFPYRFKGIEKE